jgi:type II secretory pathway component PulF
MYLGPLTHEKYVSVVLFTERFATLIETGGLSLVRSLLITREAAPEPLSLVLENVQAEVEKGATLSNALARHAEFFSAFYVKMVRAGEVGGVLDVTLRRAANLLTLEWRLLRTDDGEEPLLPGSLTTEPSSLGELTQRRQIERQLLFCETMGVLLSSGVPPRHALEVAAELLPNREKRKLTEIMQELARPEAKTTDEIESVMAALRESGFLPEFALAIIEAGVAMGNVDEMLTKTAALFEHELAVRTF